MLEIIKNNPNSVINLSKIESIIAEEAGVTAYISPKYSNNIVSSSNKYSITSKVKTYEEYRRIKQEGNFPSLTEEDMRWIDENVRELPNIPS